MGNHVKRPPNVKLTGLMSAGERQLPLSVDSTPNQKSERAASFDAEIKNRLTDEPVREDEVVKSTLFDTKVKTNDKDAHSISSI